MTKSLKKEIYKRDKFSCRKCGSYGKDLQIHHVEPQRIGGVDAEYNLCLLCASCHSYWHKLERLLDIQFSKKRTIDTFYNWLKGTINDKILLGNRRIRKKS